MNWVCIWQERKEVLQVKAKKQAKEENTRLINFLSSVLAIVAGLIIGFFILLLTNPKQSGVGFLTILMGGFADGLSGVGQMLYVATPIIMTGLSVGFAFKTGLFNIGASGQFTLGAFAAIYVGIKWDWLPGGIHWIVAILAAAVCGALWGLLPGILKAFLNVNEVISSIMMNYIGMYLVNMMVVRTVYDQVKNQSKPVKATANLPRLGLDQILGPNMNIGIFIAIIFVILIYILIEKTTFGYELKACGHNPHASKYAGINAKRNVVLSMCIAGALAGIGGALLYLSGSGKYLQVLDVIAPEGFNGISVALLGLSHPIGILFSGLFIGHLTVGGYNLQLYDYVTEVIDIIIAVIIYFGAFALLFKNVIRTFMKRVKKEDESR